MKKKIIFLTLTLISTLISLAFSSCNKEDEVYSESSFYLQFNNIRAVGADQELLNETLHLNSGYRLNGANELLGIYRTYNEARECCEDELLPLVTELNEMFSGRNLLPYYGYIYYNFTLSEFESGNIVAHPRIRVTNEGATYM